MQIIANTPEEYVKQVPSQWQKQFEHIRNIIKDNLPYGFKETLDYDMITFVVPRNLYKEGYHANKKELPFISLGIQKDYIALYHFGLYADEELLKWFEEEYKKVTIHKLDMGKSCIRFKYQSDIPYYLIRELATKITPEKWIKIYQRSKRKTP